VILCRAGLKILYELRATNAIEEFVKLQRAFLLLFPNEIDAPQAIDLRLQCIHQLSRKRQIVSISH
jgi:hypothetical protein